MADVQGTSALPIVVSIASAIVSAALFAITFLGYRNNRRAIQRGIMAQLMAEYASPEMLLALEQLHRFRERRRKQGKTMKQEYDEQRQDDLRELKDMKPSLQPAFVKTRLHYHRRLVSTFYQRVYWLVREGALPAKMAFEEWTPGDLRKILECTLIPLEWDPAEKFRELIRIAERVRRRPQVTSAEVAEGQG